MSDDLHLRKAVHLAREVVLRKGDWTMDPSLLAVLMAEYDLLHAQRAEVLAFHFPDSSYDGEPTGFCDHCRVMWPCPTAEALGVSA